MENTRNETVVNMLNDLGIDPAHHTISLQRLSETDSRFLRDLKLNISAVMSSKNLNRKEACLLALSVAVNEKNVVLINAFEQMARHEGTGDAGIAEVHACTALMNANNIFYRFRHYMQSEYYNNTPAGLRMNAMMNPVLGKEFFELMSLVISAVNGCERCVTSHEQSVREHGASEARVYDAIRLASVIKSLSVVV